MGRQNLHRDNCRCDLQISKMPYHTPNPLTTELAPKAPSALIKSARWGALLLGIVYGHYRLKYLINYETKLQADEKQIREYIKAKADLVRENKVREELIDLKKVTVGE